MRHSKLLLLILITLQACSNKGADPVAESKQEATFVVDPVSVEVTDASADAEFRGLTNARNFRFRACIKDVAVLQPVVGASFGVFDGANSLGEQSSDALGCIYWTERFAFSPTASETYLKAERRLVALSVHKGTVILPLVVNPWRKDGEAFRDLRVQPKPDVVRERSAQNLGSGSATLHVDSLAAELSFPRPGSLSGRLELSFEPKLKRLGAEGRAVIEGLSEGRLALRLQLVATHGEQQQPLTQPFEASEVLVRAGAARWSGEAPLLELPARDSFLELHFEARALGTSALAPARGRLQLGRLTGPLLSRSGGVQDPGTDRFLEPKAVPGSPKAGEPRRSWNFQAGKVTAERVEVVALDGIGKPRLLEYQLLACLKNSLSLDPVVGEKFLLKVDGVSEEKQSEPDTGCIRWKQKVEFNFTSSPKPIRSEIELQGLSGYYEGARDSRTIYLLPWQASSGASLLDERFDGTPSPSVAADSAVPELLLTSAACKFKARTFELDSFLNLSTVRRYRFSLSPAIRRMTRASGWLPPEGISSGRFRLRFLLESNDLNDPQVIDAREVEAEASGGVIQADVDFRFRDLTLVTSRLQITIEVRPLDAAIPLKSVPVSDTIELLRGGTLSLLPRAGSIDGRMALGAVRHEAPSEVDAASVFAKSFGLEEIPAEKTDARAAAEGLAVGTENSLANLCGLFYQPNRLLRGFSALERCRARPADFLMPARTQHVGTLRSYRLLEAPESFSITMSAGFSASVSQSNSRTTTRSRSADASVNIGGDVPLLNLVGIKLGMGVRYGEGWSYSQASSSTESTGRSRTNSISRTLTADQARFEVQADVRRCVTVAEKDSSSGRKFFHCARGLVPATFSESYYVISEQPMPSAVQDPEEGMGHRPFASIVRGPDRFQAFVKSLEDKNVQIQSSGVSAVPAGLRQAMPSGSFDGLFPSLVMPK